MTVERKWNINFLLAPTVQCNSILLWDVESGDFFPTTDSLMSGSTGGHIPIQVQENDASSVHAFPGKGAYDFC